MTRCEFIEKLKKNGIEEEIVSFDNQFKDGYCIRKSNYGWEVFLLERGKEYNSIGFPSESDALQNLYEKIVSIYPIHKTGD